MENKIFKVWTRTFDENGNVVGVGRYHKDYKYILSAQNRARMLCREGVEAVAGVLNPFETHTKEVECEVCKRHYDMPIDPAYGYENYSSVCLVSRVSPLPPEYRNIEKYTFKKICPSCMNKIEGYLNSISKDGGEEA